jgi:HEAT repeat protein
LKSDRHAFWRQFTFLALLIGFPVMLYMLWHAFFKRLAMFFFKPDISQAAASGLCLITGIAMLAYLHLGRGQALETEHPEAALSSADWRLRVAALKLLPRKGLDVSDYPAYSAMLKSPHIAERYYLVRALGVSRRAQTYRDLLAFLDDPHPNVVCMAFFALGQRGNRRAIDAIIQKLETSGHWYEQWYGYKALRILGWKQTGSN